jgi:hypothetical protein
VEIAVPKTKSNKPKKLRIKTVQNEFNHLIASGKPCTKCGQLFPVMQCSHNHSVGAYPNLRFDPMNVLPLCGHCHPFWWHLEPAKSWDWFKNKYPGRYAYLEVAKNKYIKWTQDKLLEVREKIKNEDLKGLLISPELLDTP